VESSLRPFPFDTLFALELISKIRERNFDRIEGENFKKSRTDFRQKVAVVVAYFLPEIRKFKVEYNVL
jgi:hypothetical protein